jgi:hypothetical protein
MPSAKRLIASEKRRRPSGKINGLKRFKSFKLTILLVGLVCTPDRRTPQASRTYDVFSCMLSSGIGAGATNRNVSALRFFFRVTLKYYAPIREAVAAGRSPSGTPHMGWLPGPHGPAWSCLLDRKGRC